MRSRHIGLIAGAALLLIVAARQPSADIKLLTHDAHDPSPHQVQAAVDLGVMTFTILYTWTGRQLLPG